MSKSHLSFLTEGLGCDEIESLLSEMAPDLSEAPEGAGGGMTTGGMESIFMAVWACREWLCEVKGRSGSLNIVAAESVHPAFDKAGETMKF